MARYTSGKQGVIPRYDIASILVFNERIYEYGDKVKLLFLLAVNYLEKPLAVLYFIAIFALRLLCN